MLTNIARGKRYRYVNREPKNYYTDPEVNKLTDGKYEFSWENMIGWDSLQETIIIEVDLEEIREGVVGASAFSIMAAPASVGLPASISVEVSQDGEVYSPLGQALRNPAKLVDNSLFEYSIKFAPLALRYIRYIIEPSKNAGWCMLTELKVWQEEEAVTNSKTPSAFLTWPRVINLSADSATIDWTMQEEVFCTCSYTSSPINKRQESIVLEPNRKQELVLNNLLPDTDYSLIIQVQDNSYTLSFHTEPLAILRGPILGINDENNLQISFESNASVNSLLEYWPSNNNQQVFVATLKETRHKETVHYVSSFNGLEPGEKYCYRLLLKSQENTLSSSKFEFIAPTSELNAAIRFLVLGDTQHALSQAEVVEEMKKIDDFNFLLHVGDLVNQPGNELDWTALFNYTGSLMAKAPFLPTLGNHEDHHERYFKYFDLPGKKECYSVDYGPLQIFCLDSTKEGPIDLGQREWLARELEASKKPFKIVFCHHPIFMNYETRETWSESASDLGNLFSKNKVALVFGGHAHIYDHVEKAGVHYVVTGGGGGYQIAKSKSPFGAPLHFLEVLVNSQGITVRAIKPGGDIVEEFSIRDIEF